ncbi:MAG: hypothetical protein M3Z36_07380 [Acidobacteriota bacterium]|nr:hypothetical protein [Acidobacteriota bacterium]
MKSFQGQKGMMKFYGAVVLLVALFGLTSGYFPPFIPRVDIAVSIRR